MTRTSIQKWIEVPAGPKGMFHTRPLSYVFWLVLLGTTVRGVPLCAQAVSPPASAASAGPVVTFTLDFPGSDPSRYAIQVPREGDASYDSRAKLSPDSDDTDAFHLDFKISEAMRKKIFDLTAHAGYFQNSVESRRRVASTGSKTLAYRDAQRSTQATYNYSQMPVVQELTTLFQNISLTLEFAHRLQYDYHYQKLALDAELKRMEEMSKANSLEELQAAEPILNQIVGDPSVINVVRARAQRLLAKAGGAPAQ
ncbi:MAG: hypothetical protein DMG71_20085 [Acidobacteria bacterium]|nr:MAG: hypothetical protein DMG71_20085 [Acidobacteriota bacterium]